MKTLRDSAMQAVFMTAALGTFLIASNARAACQVPLCPGLTIVTAVSQAGGDYESIKTIESVSPTEIRLRYSSESKSTDIFSTGPPTLTKMNFGRTMLVKDLQTATDYQQVYFEKSDEKIPRTTSIGTSTAVLQSLKSKGQSAFGYSNAYAGLSLTSNPKKYPNYYSYLQRGVIKRVAGPATTSVIVNNVPVNLPVVHAEGTFLGDKVDFLFLDDPTNPLTLGFRIGIGAIKPLTPEELKLCKAIAKGGGVPGGHCNMPNGGDRDSLRVVKIDYRCQAAGPVHANDLEKALASQQKVDLYSIYFSFNSDALRDESTPTLKEIADILSRHPDWRIAVSGHTDSIGVDQYNLDLSKRRAAAVVNALVSGYHINGGRLKSTGYGKSQPKDTNDTLEGRARNRRVELMRF